MSTWALVMAGGQGARLWPLSRKANPKQFLTLYGQKSLIENTIDRVSKLVSQKHILIITDSENVKRVRKLFPRIPKDQIIGEPIGRNTAATIGLAAALVHKQDPKAVLCAFPSDHVILNHQAFIRCLRIAVSWAKHGSHHVVFGVKPTFPSTAYGYLEMGHQVSKEGIFVAQKYIEKPNHKTAVQLLKKKKYLWQSGIFVFQAETILNSLRRFLPLHYRTVIKIAQSYKKSSRTLPFAQLFRKLSSISIDYGVMEKIGKSYVIPAQFDWNDIGSWNALEGVWPHDSDGNWSMATAVSVDSTGNLLFSKNRLIALTGVRNLVVIDSGDTILICAKSYAEKIRDLITVLKTKKLERYL